MHDLLFQLWKIINGNIYDIREHRYQSVKIEKLLFPVLFVVSLNCTRVLCSLSNPAYRGSKVLADSRKGELEFNSDNTVIFFERYFFHSSLETRPLFRIQAKT